MTLWQKIDEDNPNGFSIHKYLCVLFYAKLSKQNLFKGIKKGSLE